MRLLSAFIFGLVMLGLGAAGMLHAQEREANAAASPFKRSIWNREWDFRLEDEPGKGPWQSVHLPHSFSMPYFLSNAFYMGKGTYRKTLTVPPEWEGRKIFLECEGAFQLARVEVNGKVAGRHEGGYTAFRVDLTPFLKPGANTVTVEVDNRWRPGVAPRAGEHVFSGGLYRNVYLHVCDPVHIPLHGVWVQTPEVSARQGKVRVETELKNDSDKPEKITVRHTVREAAGGRVVTKGDTVVNVAPGELKKATANLPPVINPRLWNPSSPFMYRVDTELVNSSGKVLDRDVNPLGFRSLLLTADKGLLINGKPVYLQGANVHQDHAGWGDAVTNSGARRDVKLMKEAGFNFIRTSHYPHSRAFAEACDKEGMFALNEGIFWGMGGFQNEPYWNSDAYPDNEQDAAAFAESCKRQVREMVLEFRNHPSAIIWSISNEPFFTKHTPEAKKLCEELIALVKETDPTRPVCAGGAQRGGFDKLGDLAALNGDGAHFKTEGRPSMVSEYGSVVCKRPGAYAPGWGDLNKDKEAKAKYPWRIGEAIWCGFDHGSIWPSGARMGIVDYFRIPKRSWYWYRNEFRKIPPPEWPVEGKPARLELSADKKIISPANGTDDVHLMVEVMDASGKRLSNKVPVTLSVESGPGEFPTGKSITFTPNTDIDMIDGCAAIEFRSYYAGETVIKASSPGLKDDRIRIVSKNAPAFAAGKSKETLDRPYKRFSEEDKKAQMARFGESGASSGNEEINLAMLRPCSASSGVQNAMMAADGDKTTGWTPDAADKTPWWRLNMEFDFSLAKIDVEAAGARAWKGAAPTLQTSMDGKTWKDLPAKLVNNGAGLQAVCPEGTRAQYLRIRMAPGQGIAEVTVIPAGKK